MKIATAILVLAAGLAAANPALDKRRPSGTDPLPPPEGNPRARPAPPRPAPAPDMNAQLADLERLQQEAEQLQNQFRQEFRPGEQGGGQGGGGGAGQGGRNPCAIL
ncbi:hypothetical protein CDD83_5791 [Cordyceps sp. RAO-2017]|nr:hypothetical protein CDD83_5791 [Cordyceps sp. RAO-2017]